MSAKRYCFVVPRYFEGIAGGAETLLGAIATRLAQRGDYVELLTTCAKDNRTWSNEYSPGESCIHGFRVLRFPVDERDLEKWVPVQCAIHDGRGVSYEDQLVWMQESVNSRALYRYIAEYGQSYDAIFFGPYLFGTTIWGSQIYPKKSILVPCLHDEVYAYLDVIAAMFRGVRGCLFNAEPEMHLARSLYGDVRGGVVGMGFEPPSQGDVDRLQPYFDGASPYIVYLGRKEMGKNVHVLIDYFCAMKDRGVLPQELRLVVLGGGSFSDLHRPEVLCREDVIDLPHVTEEEKSRLLKHALYLCQPSVNESFSIVLMEAWMVGTPVVVHGECPITKHHVVESGGGLYFSSPEDLAGVTRYMLEERGARERFAACGRRYVEFRYSWKSVLDRFDQVLGEILREGEESRV
jgi:glycosyltransferase involved in cell wall biosynthesis